MYLTKHVWRQTHSGPTNSLALFFLFLLNFKETSVLQSGQDRWQKILSYGDRNRQQSLQQEATRPNEVTVATCPNEINVVVFHLIREPLSDQDPSAHFSSTHRTKIGTIPRRLAWPLPKDEKRIREVFHGIELPHCFHRARTQQEINLQGSGSRFLSAGILIFPVSISAGNEYLFFKPRTSKAKLSKTKNPTKVS